MLKNTNIPSKVSDQEEIARVLFSPFMVDKDKVSPTAFSLRNLKKPETYVSVFRNDYIDLTREKVSYISAPEGNKLYGYALINVGECRNVSFKDITTDVVSYPSKANPYHAGIHYNKGDVGIKGACIDPDFLIITRLLANKSRLISF